MTCYPAGLVLTVAVLLTLTQKGVTLSDIRNENGTDIFNQTSLAVEGAIDEFTGQSQKTPNDSDSADVNTVSTSSHADWWLAWTHPAFVTGPPTDDTAALCSEIIENCTKAITAHHDTLESNSSTLSPVPDYCNEDCGGTTNAFLLIRHESGLTLSQTFLALMIATGLPVAMFVLLVMGLIHLIAERARWPARHPRPQRLQREPSLSDIVAV